MKKKTMKATELIKRYLSGERQFTCVNLEGVDLSRANLSYANLKNANLENANLENADLESAYLYSANLRNANLKNANLENVYLENTNLKNANLTGTIFDPQAKIPEISDEEILSAGLEIHGEYVAGYRTKISQHVGYQEYKVGEEYKAPVFSVDKNTLCHPGIYLAPKKWLLDIYPNCEIVRCFCRRDELIHAGNKWRAKRIRVIEYTY